MGKGSLSVTVCVGKDTSDEDREKANDKKKVLVEQFLINCGLKAENKTVKNNELDSKQFNKKEKIVNKPQIDKFKSDIANYKERIFFLENKNKKYFKNISEKDGKIKEQAIQINELTIALNNLEKEKNRLAANFEETQAKLSNNNIIELNNRILNLTEHNQKLWKNIKGLNNYIKKTKSVGGERDKLISQIDNLNNSKDSLLMENRNLKNKLGFFLEEKNPVKINQSLKIVSTLDRNNIVEINEKMGVITSEDGLYIFTDFDGQVFTNIELTQSLNEQGFCYCIATIKNKESMCIKETFPLINTKDELLDYLYQKDLKKKSLRKQKSILKGNYIKSAKDLVSFKGENVLLICSQNAAKYKFELEKQNLNVILFDSYKVNPIRLQEQIKGKDLVINCTASSRHFVSDIITQSYEYKSNTIKFEEIYKENASKLLMLINYMIEN